jgi:molybdopterin synthase catalytic subunit
VLFPVTDVRPLALTRSDAPSTDDWCALSDEPLDIALAMDWATRPHCGALVTFCGLVRDHSEGRPGVTVLEYEAYAEEVAPRLARVAAAARARWPELGRLVLWHRVGRLAVGEAAVVVVASTPSRDAAFAAARFGIDTVKETVPIWKRETWAGGTDWSLCCHPIAEPGAAAGEAGSGHHHGHRAADAP